MDVSDTAMALTRAKTDIVKYILFIYILQQINVNYFKLLVADPFNCVLILCWASASVSELREKE